ncbi:hypothetical protein RU639_009106 [Aspergillus parasiticus]
MGDEIELLHWGTGFYAKFGVASSRSRDVAKEFLESFDVPECTLTFRDYSELICSDLIDVVFIATPHSHHFQNALLALEVGNHVVYQKSLTVNAAQTKKLFETAKREQLFLMEGWERLDKLILADGALLELGSLALHWILRALPGGACRPNQITSTMKNCPESGVDETTTIDMVFSTGGREIRTEAIASLSTPASPDGQLAHMIIEGSNGKIEIRGWEAIPTELYLFNNSYSLSKPYDVTFHEGEPLMTCNTPPESEASEPSVRLPSRPL